ncbi:MAG: hypothetical protein EAX96_00920 [Candidatus Lokiarchaeota archaeon]|nr:hypothetical protein [Candidatus Lokiarchaeota archaeon]
MADEWFKIGEINDLTKSANLMGKLIDRIEIKTVTLKKTQETIEVAEYLLADDTASIIYQVWGDKEILETDKNIGKVISIKNGWVSSFANKFRISKGKKGEVEVLDEDIPTIEISAEQLKGIKEKIPISVADYFNVRDLKKGSKNVNIKLKIIRKDQPRRVKNNLTVGTFLVGDPTGCILLTLWNEEIFEFDLNDFIEINNGYVSTFNNVLQLNKGKYGKIKKIKDKFEVNEENNLSLDY